LATGLRLRQRQAKAARFEEIKQLADKQRLEHAASEAAQPPYEERPVGRPKQKAITLGALHFNE